MLRAGPQHSFPHHSFRKRMSTESEDIEINHIGIVHVCRATHQRTGSEVYIVGSIIFKHHGTVDDLKDEIVQRDTTQRFKIEDVTEEHFIERVPIETAQQREERVYMKKTKIQERLQREGKEVLVF